MPAATPDTRLYMSFSARPGRFGATVYASLFERFGLDALYVPRAAPGSAEELVGCIRTLGLAGASVSSPHKSGVVEHLDSLDEVASACGAVNTIVRASDGAYRGYCTDGHGVEGALRGEAVKTAVVYGSGGVVGPTVIALRRLGAERIFLAARNLGAVGSLCERFGVAPWSDGKGPIDVAINATPLGDDVDLPAEFSALLERSSVLLDMPVSPTARPIWSAAESIGVRVIPGTEMCVHQIVEQAGLYLGREIPIDAVREAVAPVFGG